MNEAQPIQLCYFITRNNVSLTPAPSETRSVDFFDFYDWNGRPTYLPLILR